MRENGFTLIELLAVLIVLGVLILLIAPKIVTTLNEAEYNANMASARELVKAAELKHANNEMMGKLENVIIDYSSNQNENYLDYKGDKPEKGRVTIKKNGDVAMAVKFGDNCYLKTGKSNDITVSSYSESGCGRNASVFINYDLPDVAMGGQPGLYESKIQSKRFVYRGNVNDNYIELIENGVPTMYRIISYEADDSIKVIRDTSIGNMAWDERTSETEGPRKNDNNTYCNYTGTYYGCNVWSNMNDTTYNGTPLSTLFSNNFHYKYFSSSTSELLDHSTNGTVKDNSSLNTYLNGEWLTNSGLNDYINPNTNFSVGGLYYYSTYTGGDKGLEKELEEINSYKWQGKVGLMYITDMVETSLSNSCDSVYDNFYYNPNYYYKDTGSETASQHITNGNWPCTKDNWLFKGITEWSLSANSYYRNGVWSVSGTGYFDYNRPYNALGARPAFYLKSSIQLSGSGTISDPYRVVTG